MAMSVSISQRLGDFQADVDGRFQSADASLSGLRDELGSLKTTLAAAPTSAMMAELNDSIRALSLRLGFFESGNGDGNRGVISDSARDAPPLRQTPFTPPEVFEHRRQPSSSTRLL